MTAAVQQYTRGELDGLAWKDFGPHSIMHETSLYATRIKRLLATARAGLEDRERLDWFARQTEECSGDQVYCFEGTWFSRGAVDNLEPDVDHATMREAIDAARNEGMQRSGQRANDG